VERSPRKARNPQDNSVIDLPATEVIVFRPGKPLKQSVNNSYVRRTKVLAVV
jgi:nucleoid DNA-binding protein